MTRKEAYAQYEYEVALFEQWGQKNIITFEEWLGIKGITIDKPSLPAGLDEAAEEFYNAFCDDGDFDGHYKGYVINAFKAGAKWMAGQGQTEVLTVESPLLGPPMICCPVKEHKNGDKVIVQIRKK